MAVDDRDRELVRLTGAGSQLEAGAIRGYLEDNGIFCFIQGQQHSSLFGAAGVIAIQMNLMVPRADLERAHELLIAFRESEPILEPDGWTADESGDESEDELKDKGEEETEKRDAEEEMALEVMRRRYNRKKAALLALIPSFGCSHLYTGAYGRAFVLAAAELIGILFWRVYPLAGLLTPLAVIVDLIGGTERVKALQRNALPRARALKRPGGGDGR